MPNVLVILGGKQITLGDSAAGASARGRVVPVADSDVAISFADGTAATQVVRVDTYVTNGIKGKVDADVADGQLKGSKADLSVSILESRTVVHRPPMQWNRKQDRFYFQ